MTWSKKAGFRLDRQLFTAAIIFAVLSALFFHPILLQDKTLADIAGHQSIQFPWAVSPTGFIDAVQSDQANNIYPIQADQNRQQRNGEFPFWSNYSFGGGPTLGTVYGTAFYPPRFLLSFVLAPIQINDLLLLAHSWLAGFALFLLLRRLGASWLAGMFGGVAWMICPAWFGTTLIFGTGVLAALLPLTLWLMHRAVTRESVPNVVGCGAALAVLVLGASVQYAVYCIAIVCVWGLLLGQNDPGAGKPRAALLRRNARLVAIAGGLGIALSAFLVLPATDQIDASGRAPIPFSQLSELGLDRLLHVADPRVPNPVDGDAVWSLTFIGIPAALFAVVGLFSRRPGAGLARTLVILFVLLMVGTPATQLAYQIVPGFSYLEPLGRLLPFVSFGLVLLAAIGLDVTTEQVVRRNYSRGLIAAFTAVVVMAIAFEAYQTSTFSLDANPDFQPRSSSYLYPRTPLIEALSRTGSESRDAGDAARMIPVRRGAPTDPFYPPPMVGEVHRLFAVESIGGYLNVVPQRSLALSLFLSGATAAVALKPHVGSYISFYYSDRTRFDLLERLGVNEIVAAPSLDEDPRLARAATQLGGRVEYSGADGTLVKLPEAAPRAYVVDGVEVVGSASAAFDRFTRPSFPFRTTTVLDGPRSRAVEETAPSGQIAADVRMQSDSNKRRIEVDSPRAGWLVVLDTWDGGWSAKVDGRDEPVQRANFAYQAVRIPEGQSTVEMHYRAPGLTVGILITLAGAGASVILLLLPRRRRVPS